ncbi:hypothetical protein [Streptomyces sp. NPDC014734]|uniref:hypothetical protein n=1 Tax=Streptomyces sp. NPDC014734 TaxID=3364886 RepID=UPI0036F9F432
MGETTVLAMPSPENGVDQKWEWRSLFPVSDRCPSDPVAEQYSSLLAPGVLSREIQLRRVGVLHSAILRLRDLATNPWLIVEPTTFSSLPEGLDIARVLLRTAEGASGIPCSTSGLLHTSGPAPMTTPRARFDGQHQLSSVKSILWHAAGSGKTETFVLRLVDQLTQQVSRLNRHGHRPTAAELGGIADAAHALSTLLLALAQRLLTGCVQFFAHLVTVPRTESSPCGLSRLAAPCVPRAPGMGLASGPNKFALAV